MKKNPNTTVLDVTRGFAFTLLYQPTIGIKTSSQYPLAIRFPSAYRQFRRRSQN